MADMADTEHGYPKNVDSDWDKESTRKRPIKKGAEPSPETLKFRKKLLDSFEERQQKEKAAEVKESMKPAPTSKKKEGSRPSIQKPDYTTGAPRESQKERKKIETAEPLWSKVE